MNNTYSPPKRYLDRGITRSLQDASRDHAVIVLTGARQVGKSTLLLNSESFRDWRCLSMVKFDFRSQLFRESKALRLSGDRIIPEVASNATSQFS